MSDAKSLWEKLDMANESQAFESLRKKLDMANESQEFVESLKIPQVAQLVVYAKENAKYASPFLLFCAFVQNSRIIYPITQYAASESFIKNYSMRVFILTYFPLDRVHPMLEDILLQMPNYMLLVYKKNPVLAQSMAMHNAKHILSDRFLCSGISVLMVKLGCAVHKVELEDFLIRFRQPNTLDMPVLVKNLKEMSRYSTSIRNAFRNLEYIIQCFVRGHRIRYLSEIAGYPLVNNGNIKIYYKYALTKYATNRQNIWDMAVEGLDLSKIHRKWRLMLLEHPLLWRIAFEKGWLAGISREAIREYILNHVISHSKPHSVKVLKLLDTVNNPTKIARKVVWNFRENGQTAMASKILAHEQFKIEKLYVWTYLNQVDRDALNMEINRAKNSYALKIQKWWIKICYKPGSKNLENITRALLRNSE